MCIFFKTIKRVGFVPESKLKSTIIRSLIHMDFIGLVTWSGEEGYEKRIREAQKVFKGYIK